MEDQRPLAAVKYRLKQHGHVPRHPPAGRSAPPPEGAPSPSDTGQPKPYLQPRPRHVGTRSSSPSAAVPVRAAIHGQQRLSRTCPAMAREPRLNRSAPGSPLDVRYFPSSERGFDFRRPLHDEDPGQRPGSCLCLGQFRHLAPEGPPSPFSAAPSPSSTPNTASPSVTGRRSGRVAGISLLPPSVRPIRGPRLLWQRFLVRSR